MKTLKYLAIAIAAVGFTACNSDDDNIRRQASQPLPPLTAGTANFSNYVAVGASFTAGYTDGALFINAQENSFPNTLASQFAKAGGGVFSQPLMNDNIGGILIGGVQAPGQGPRLYFNGTGPVPLSATPTTEAGVNVGPANNMGVPGAKSFHITLNGYGAFNPYYARMASSANASVLEDAVAQNPTFFTLSEIGGNDVLGYALSGGESDMDADNYNPITPTATFNASFNDIVDGLTANGAKGVVANVPYITDLAHFTTVPYAPLDPTNESFGPLIPQLNAIFGALNPVLQALDTENDRTITFATDAASPVVIKDENLADIGPQMAAILGASPQFAAFIQQFGLPAAAAPAVANILGGLYGQTRQATANDLLVLRSRTVIGQVNTEAATALVMAGLSPQLAGQFSVEGVTYGLDDKWVLLPQEQEEIKMTIDAYNATIAAAANGNANVALVDLNQVLADATSNGVEFDAYTMNTALVTGGLISLDGIHLTARGYALMANKFLEAIDTNFGSNFVASGNVAKADSYPIAYSPNLQ